MVSQSSKINTTEGKVSANMQFKVEIVSVDSDDERRDVSFFAYVEAPSQEKAIEIAKELHSKINPHLPPGSRWAWFAYATNEQKSR